MLAIVRILRHVTKHGSGNTDSTCEANVTIQRGIPTHHACLLMDVGVAFPWLQAQGAKCLPLELNPLYRSSFR